MVWPLVIGAAMVVGGAVSQAIGAGKAERAKKRALRNISREQTRYADERRGRYDNLTAAMTDLSERHGVAVDEFWDDKNAPARTQAAEAAGKDFLGQAIAGGERGAGLVETGDAPVMSNAFAKSMAVAEAQVAPTRAAERELIRVSGEQAGRDFYDQTAGDRLNLTQADLGAEQLDTQLPFEIGSQERLNSHNRLMEALQRAYGRAGEAGSGERLVGSLAQTIGGSVIGGAVAGMTSPGPGIDPNFIKTPVGK
jgi:hypothetical protein